MTPSIFAYRCTCIDTRRRSRYLLPIHVQAHPKGVDPTLQPVRNGMLAGVLAAEVTWRKHSGQLGKCVQTAALNSDKVVKRNVCYQSGSMLS
jgi:hypothetical protein